MKKIKINESQYKRLFREQKSASSVDKKKIDAAYNGIISAVKYPGTDWGELISSIQSLSPIEFSWMLSLSFKDGKTGYKTFTEMVNGEYERDNVDDLKKLRSALKTLGFNSDWETASNRIGWKLSIENTWSMSSFSIDNITCLKEWMKLLPAAINFWVKWLNNDITKQKFKRNHKIEDDGEVEEWFEKYNKALTTMEIFTSNKLEDAYAYVNPTTPGEIFVNCDYDDPDKLGTLTHEIQHLLWFIKPLNPEKQVGDVFVKTNTKKLKPEDFSSVDKSINKEFTKKVNVNLKELNMSEKDWVKAVKDNSVRLNKSTKETHDILTNIADIVKKKEYSCDETEKMSNITSIRNLLKIKPGKNITIDMLKPYIVGEKSHTDVYWILNCWAYSGFTDINKVINNMNQLAIKGDDNSTDMFA
jgi:hypothetical protein